MRALREQQGVEKPKPKRENSEASRSELDVLGEKSIGKRRGMV